MLCAKACVVLGSFKWSGVRSMQHQGCAALQAPQQWHLGTWRLQDGTCNVPHAARHMQCAVFGMLHAACKLLHVGYACSSQYMAHATWDMLQAARHT